MKFYQFILIFGATAFMTGCHLFSPTPCEVILPPNFLHVAIIDSTPDNLKTKIGRPMVPEYITIHNTATTKSAMTERNYVNIRTDGTSFHLAVDENEAVQIIPFDRNAWHAGDKRGDGNMKSIGVEICRSMCRGDSDYLYTRSEENAVLLTAWLLYRFNLTPDDLRMHQDWSGKHCPHRILDEGRWESFKARVAEKLYPPTPREKITTR